MAGKLTRWAEWMDRQGFYVVLCVCIAVIVASAIWARVPLEEGDPGLTANQAPDFVQSLADVTPLLAVPTATPTPRTRPVSGDVLREFSPEQPLYQATLDAWSVHMGVDLAADKGGAVLAIADGTVKNITKSALHGLTLEIDHSNGLITRMMGMATITVTEGTSVRMGQSVGTAGGSHPAESLDRPHVHFELWQDGVALDPLSILP